MCFMILGEKDFKKLILDELGQNRVNIENWRRNHDKKDEALVINWKKNSMEELILEYLGEF